MSKKKYLTGVYSYDDTDVLKKMLKMLLDELRALNKVLDVKKSMNEISPGGGTLLFGVNPSSKISKEGYKQYASFTNAVNEILNDYGISKKNNGYTYIVDAVKLIIDQENMDTRLGNDVYPYIKKKYKLNSISVVEHAIRNAIKSSFQKCKNGDQISRMDAYDKKPTNKQFLMTISRDVLSKMINDMALKGI